MARGKCLKLASGLGTLGLFLFTTMAFGQGLLVNVEPDVRIPLPRPIPIPTPRPEPPASYKIKELAVQGKLVDQIARIQVSQSFVNTGSRQMEVCFVFPLPYDGAVDSLILLVDGKEFPAKLLDAKQARAEYEQIVRRNQDPALLEWIGTGMFKTSVFPVPPGAERKVTLRYSQLCRQSDGLTDFLFPLSTAKFTSQPVEKIAFDMAIESREPIKNVYSPSHAVNVKRPDDRHAMVSFESSSSVPTHDFRLFYDVGDKAVGATLLSFRPDKDDDGFFLLLAAPEMKEDGDRIAKTVVFVLDRSGSMSGKKIEQAKEAAKFVLNNLHEGDLFNIVAYDSEVESFRPELQKYNDESRRAALGFVEGLFAGGSTNIEGALQTALKLIQDSSRPNYLLFLTDGLPTVGEQNESKLVSAANDQNDVKVRIFPFGVGYDVNSRLLDRLARSSRGLSNYVRPDQDLEGPVGKLYSKLSAPVMTGVSITYEMDGAGEDGVKPVNRIYPKDAVDFFRGEQVVLAGRYHKPGGVKIVIEGKLGGENKRFEFRGDFAEHSADESQAFVERLWAVRRIGEILDELDLQGQNAELVQELVALSTKHGIITPYTSFLADESTQPSDLRANAIEAGIRLRGLEEAEGRGGFDQRLGKNLLIRAEQLDAASNESLYRYYSADAFAPGGVGGPAGGFGGRATNVPALRGVAAPASGPVADLLDVGAQTSPVEFVQNVGRKAFYKRGERWIDGSVDEEKQAHATRVTRYSDEYFALVSQHGNDAGKYLAIEGPVVVELDGQVYEVVDP